MLSYQEGNVRPSILTLIHSWISGIELVESLQFEEKSTILSHSANSSNNAIKGDWLWLKQFYLAKLTKV
jgi:hypothetical protein